MAKDPIRSAAGPSLEELKAAVAQSDKRAFNDSLNRLVQNFTAGADNPGGYGLEDCERCTECMFCSGCNSCYQCTHCTDCELCNRCSHCTDSKVLTGCAYTTQSEHCTNSAYLVLSRNCSDCNYCFGCVGLSKKDFHILNVPFSRQQYFEIVRRLRRELGLPA